MARLSEEEQAQLEALEAKRNAPEEDDEPGGPNDGVIVLVGKRADDFLGSIFGTGGKTPAKKAAPAKSAKPPAKKAAPAKSTRPPAEDPEDPEDPEDDEPEVDDDPAPPPAHRYFR